MDVKLLEHNPGNLDSSPPDKSNYIVDKNIAIALSIQGKSDKEIGDNWNVSRQAIWLLLKPYRKQIQSFKLFQLDKATSFEWLQFKLGRSLTDKDLNKLKADKKIAAMERLDKLIKLDRGQATEIKRVEIAFDLSAFR